MSIVALQDLKDYARIDFSDDDAMLSAFLESAQVHIESFVGNKLDDATRFSRWHARAAEAGDENAGLALV